MNRIYINIVCESEEQKEIIRKLLRETKDAMKRKYEPVVKNAKIIQMAVGEFMAKKVSENIE